MQRWKGFLNKIMAKRQSESPSYTLILHKPRLKLGLSLSEYCIAEAIYHLQSNFIVPGWCYASRNTLGSIIGLTRRGTIKMIQRLKAKGLLEINSDTDYIRTTEKWYKEVVIFRQKTTKFTGGERSSQGVNKKGVNRVHGGSEQSSQYSNIYSNNNINTPFSSKKSFSFRRTEKTEGAKKEASDLSEQITNWLWRSSNQPDGRFKITRGKLKAEVQGAILFYGYETIQGIFRKRGDEGSGGSLHFWQDIKGMKRARLEEESRLKKNKERENVLSRR